MRWTGPILLGCAGLILSGFGGAILLQGLGGWSTTLQGPGITEVQIPEAGDYRLWHESSTEIDGRLQVVEDALPSGSSIEIRDARSRTIPIEPQAGNLTVESGSSRRVAIGKTTIPAAGDYLVAIEGFETPRQFRVSQIRFFDHLLRALVFGIPGLLLLVGALTWALFISIRSRSGRN